jgi:hypothetical protein
MRHLIIKSLVVFALLIGMTTASLALPACPSSGHFDNCFGSRTYAGGDKYEGEWKNNYRHGQGTYTYANGENYVGDWNTGEKNGQGVFTWSTGNNLVGEWKNGSASGIGAYNNLATGTKYFGEWKSTKRSGQGAEIYVSGKRYVGEWKDNKKNGQGIYTYMDGSKEEGIWNSNVFQNEKIGTSFNTKTASRKLPTCPSDRSKKFNNCFGIRVYLADDDNKGDIYVGEWKNNNRHGQGTYYYLADNNNKGDIYVGQYQAGKYTGKGMYTFKDGEKYIGEWKNNKRYGQGVNTYINGSKKEGIWKDDVFQYAQKETISIALPQCVGSWTKTSWKNCYGTYTWNNGDNYTGEWKNGKQHGQGIYSHGKNSDWAGEKYVGNWRNGKRHGQGVTTWTLNGDKYVGEYKNNNRHGQGSFIHTNGDKYVGEWKENKKSGQGTYSWAGGDKYVGAWKGGNRNGQGTLIIEDGRVWFGEWAESSLTGYAILFDDDASVYQKGIFKKDEFLYAQNSQLRACPSDKSEKYDNCYGTHNYANGDKHVGEWKDDYRHGQGTYYHLKNDKFKGDKFVGEYKDGKRHGQGIYFYLRNDAAKGDKFVGEYKDDKRHGHGAYIFVNGSEFVGEYKDGKRHGYGAHSYANGSKIEGMWSNDIFQSTKSATSEDNQTATFIQETCNDDPTLCTVAQLCTKASHYSGEKKAWRKDYSSKKYVTEAKKNGVSCGVQVVVKKEKPLDNKTYKVASGTGFYVSNSGHIITNHHVIDGCKDMKVISKGRTIETLVLANDPLNDLALLKAKEASSTYFSIINRQPELLEDIIVAGFPFGNKVSSSIKFTRGIVSSLTGVGDNYSQIQIDAALQPGNSGGPIMDYMGNIVGVAVAKLSLKKIMDDYGVVPENTNFGIKASAVRNLMVGNSIAIKEPNGKNITKKQLAKLATDGTVHLTCWMTMAQIDKAIKDETGKVLFKEFQK